MAAPTLEEMVARARALRPRLAERAARTDSLGRVPDETIADLKNAGLFRVLQPLRYGGFELDYGRTQVELCRELGGPWTPEFLARVRRDVSYAVLLCTRAVDRLAPAVDAHGLDQDSAFQRAFRDVHAVANHAGGNWDIHAIPYALSLLG